MCHALYIFMPLEFCMCSVWFHHAGLFSMVQPVISVCNININHLIVFLHMNHIHIFFLIYL